MKKFLYYFGLMCIALVLFILHSAFAFSLNPIFLADEFFKDLFVLANGFDLKVYFPYAFGLAFAIAIIAIMDLMHKSDRFFWLFAFSVASMELLGMFLLCFPGHGDTWVLFSGLYYGFYFFLAVIFYFYIKPEKEKPRVQVVEKVVKQQGPVNEPRSMLIERIKELHQSGVQQKEISLMVGKDKSTVSRIIKKHKEQWEQE